MSSARTQAIDTTAKTESRDKLAWTTPALTLYGEVSELTEGGSGPVQEGMSAMGMGCGTALMKFC